MSGPIYFCNWWKCQGVKLREHTFRTCPHFAAITPENVETSWQHRERLRVEHAKAEASRRENVDSLDEVTP